MMNVKESSADTTTIICDKPLVTVGLKHSLLVFVSVGLMIGYLYLLGSCGQPLAHDSSDEVEMRDTGTMMSYLLSQPQPTTAVLKAVFGHIEGPLQYLLLNIYCYTIGNLVPLTPAVMQLPNTVFACLSVGFIFLLASRIASPRTAFLCAAVFALGPWLGITIRKSWYFNTLSCLLQASTMYFYIRNLTAPEEKFYRIAAPASLALYIMTGMDWPSFVPCLLLFFILASSRSQGVRSNCLTANGLNMIPLLAGILLVVTSIVMAVNNGAWGFDCSRLGHPFSVFISNIQENSFSRVIERTLVPWGPQMILACAGLIFHGFARRERWGSAAVRSSFLDCVSAWLIIASIGAIASSGDATYVYVLAVASAILSGLALSRLNNTWATVALVILGLFQVYIVTEKRFSFEADKKQSVLAAAYFLIEHRPDLLSGQAKPIAAGADALSVVSYMRAGTRSIIVPKNLKNKVASYPDGPYHFEMGILRSFSGESDEISRPWFIIDTEVLEEQNPARDFWLGMIHSPDIRWLARFKEEGEAELIVGEFRKGDGVPLSQAAYMEVETLSSHYSQKYR